MGKQITTLKIGTVIGLALICLFINGCDNNEDEKQNPAETQKILDSLPKKNTQAPLGLTWEMSQKEMMKVCQLDTKRNTYTEKTETPTWFATKTPITPDGTDVILLGFYKDQLWSIAVMGKKHYEAMENGKARKQLAEMEKIIAEKYQTLPHPDDKNRIMFRDINHSVEGDTTLFDEVEGGLKTQHWMIRYHYTPIVFRIELDRAVKKETARRETQKAL